MDREKFTQEVLKSENTMYHIAKGMLKSESDCEDVVSEAVLKAYRRKVFQNVAYKNFNKRML